MEAEPQSETLSDLQAAFASAGVTFRPGKLERWRRDGLLPPVEQEALGRGLGSRTRYPPGTARQAVEIERLFGIKRKLAFVGWELWWRGFEVDPRHWQPALINAHKSLPRTIRLFKRWQSRESDTDRDDTIFERHGRDMLRATPLIGTVRNMPAETVSMALGIFADAACGEFQHFDPSSTDQEGEQEYEGVRAALGMKRAEHHSVLGLRINPKPPLTEILSAIANIDWSQTEAKSLEWSALDRARTEIHDAFEAASMFYQATVWIFGNGAFGLRLADWFIDKAPIAVKATIVVLWWAIRSSENPFVEGHKIREMRLVAGIALQKSNEIQKLRSSDPLIFEMLSPKSVKRALRNANAIADLQLRIKSAIAERINTDFP